MSIAAGGGSRARALGAMAALSLAMHAGGLYLASSLEPRRPARQPPAVVDFEVETEPPTPPPTPPPPEARQVEPPPKTPTPRRVAMAKLPPPPAPPPTPSALPPPTLEPKKDAPPSPNAAPRVGISLSSTTSAGGFGVSVGNTLYGKAAPSAADPREVKPYAPEGTSPPPPAAAAARLSAQPQLLEQPLVPYPLDARKAGVEGKVKLLLHIDRQGRVAEASVLVDPGAGLGEAAREGALLFHFRPGLLDGEPVEVPDFPYTYSFVLE